MSLCFIYSLPGHEDGKPGKGTGVDAGEDAGEVTTGNDVRKETLEQSCNSDVTIVSLLQGRSRWAPPGHSPTRLSHLSDFDTLRPKVIVVSSCRNTSQHKWTLR